MQRMAQKKLQNVLLLPNQEQSWKNYATALLWKVPRQVQHDITKEKMVYKIAKENIQNYVSPLKSLAIPEGLQWRYTESMRNLILQPLLQNYDKKFPALGCDTSCQVTSCIREGLFPASYWLHKRALHSLVPHSEWVMGSSWYPYINTIQHPLVTWRWHRQWHMQKAVVSLMV